MGFNFNFSFGRSVDTDVTRYRDGSVWYNLLTGTKAKRYQDEKQKYDTVICSPVCMEIFTFICDTYSQVHFNTEKEENFLYSYKKRPNQWQTWTDLFWEHRFWLALGNAYLYKEKDIWFYLKPYGIELTERQRKSFKKIDFSVYGEGTMKGAKKGSFKYRDCNNDILTLDLKNLHIFSDLSNGVSGDWFRGDSRLDALYKIINNSELALDAEGINLEFAGKFIVSGEHNEADQYSLPMGDKEKESTEQALRGSKKVHVLKDKVNVNQFIKNLKSLGLNDSYANALSLVGNMYNVPQDVLEALKTGATYENKEKSIGQYIDYTEMPKVQQFSDFLEIELEVNEVKGSFKHLPFNQVFEAERIANNKVKMETYKLASEMGVDVKKQINELLENGY